MSFRFLRGAAHNSVLQVKHQKRRASEADIINDSEPLPHACDDISPPSSSYAPGPVAKKPRTAASAAVSTSTRSGPGTAPALHPFFLSATPPTSDATSMCLPGLSISGLTRSQRIVSVHGGLDPRSLTFMSAESEAFFLFMRLRAENKWASYSMSPSKWVAAASLYNAEVDRINTQKGKHMVRKTPRALMDKLGDIESRVLSRIAVNDYRCKSLPACSLIRRSSWHFPFSHSEAFRGRAVLA